MKKMKKILSLVLAIAMTFGCMTGTANAMTWGTKPADGVTVEQPFAPKTGGSQNFRIPCLVTLDDGTLVAACDARWNHASDACGLDTIVSYSKDNGKTWNYTFANYLGDYGNGFNYNASAFIDPSIVTDGETVYMIADIYPAGIAINTTPDTHRPLTGSTGFDANDNLILAKATDSANGLSASATRINQPFDYYLEKIEGAKDDAANYYQLKDKNGANVEGYTVDAYFNIKGEGVDTNIFCGDSPYYPWPADYLYMTKSTDGGATWSIPSLINVKRADEATVLVCPGRAVITSTGRIVFPVYEHTNGREYTSVIYSDDKGETWTRSANMNANCSEAGITEADGRLYMFTRHGGYYVSENNGTTWSAKKNVGISYDTGTQLSAITYSEKIDGKTAIMLSVPGGPSRRTNGKIFVALVQEDGSLDWAYDFNVSKDGAAFAYSCLTELANGDIGILWEHQGSAIRYDSYTLKEVLGFEKKITLDPEAQYVEEKAATQALEIKQAADEKIATVTSDFVVEEANIKLRDYVSGANASLSAFATENGTYNLSDCEFTFKQNGDKWQISNGSNYIDLSGAGNYLGTATDLTVTKVDPDAAVAGDEVFRICNADNRYAIFYTENMTFDAWSTTNIPSVKSTVKFDLVLLEKQDKISPADVMPGYTRTTEVKDGGVYLISYIWGADTEDRSDNGLIVLYPTNGQAGQTKLVGSVEATAKSVVTITGVAPGTSTAIVGDVTYHITVNDPTLSPTYEGNDYPVDKLTATAGAAQNGTTEGPAALALDGNPSTHFHSAWSPKCTDDQLWIALELEEEALVTGLRYLPRSGAGNGTVTEYELFYSADGTNWESAGTGKWDLDGSWKLARLETPVMAKYVKLFAVDSTGDGVGRHMSAAEVRVTYTTEVPEVTATPEVTEEPTEEPTVEPTEEPTVEPTEEPTVEPTEEPTVEPTEEPTVEPTEEPTVEPTGTPGVTEEVKGVFTDVYDDWYTDYVQYVYDNGLMTGIKGTAEFQPNANITKAQVAQVLYNMEKQPGATVDDVFNDLVDVYDAEWYADAVAWAYSTGVVTGDLNTKKFNPNADVTREQLALMMFRYAKYKGYNVSQTSNYEGLVNADKVNNWAAEGMSWAVGAGLISGIDKDEVKDLAPQGNASRAQVAAILQRFCENVVK